MHFAADSLVGESMQRPEQYFAQQRRRHARRCWTRCWPRCRGASSSPRPPPSTASRTPSRSRRTRRSRPINPYGESKLMVERILGWYDGCTACARSACATSTPPAPSERFGEDHRPETHLIPLVLQVALGQREQVDDLWHRLRHAGRHVHPRLRPRHRPGAGAHPGARRASGDRARSTTSAAATATRCARSSTPAAASRGHPIPSVEGRGGRATRRAWSPTRRASEPTWAGRRAMTIWTRLSPPLGAGIRPTRAATENKLATAGGMPVSAATVPSYPLAHAVWRADDPWRKVDGRMPSVARYFATVRRAMRMPCPCSRSQISSSVSARCSF